GAAVARRPPPPPARGVARAPGGSRRSPGDRRLRPACRRGIAGGVPPRPAPGLAAGRGCGLGRARLGGESAHPVGTLRLPGGRGRLRRRAAPAPLGGPDAAGRPAHGEAPPGAALGPVLGERPPAMRLGDAPDQRQAQPQPIAGLAALEWLEELLAPLA